MKVIINWWNKGQVTSAINALNMQNDLGLTMDVINATLSQNCRFDTLKTESATSFMPQVCILLESKYQNHLMAGMKAALNLLRHFSPGLI